MVDIVDELISIMFIEKSIYAFGYRSDLNFIIGLQDQIKLTQFQQDLVRLYFSKEMKLHGRESIMNYYTKDPVVIKQTILDYYFDPYDKFKSKSR